jgi:hypothetical protein
MFAAFDDYKDKAKILELRMRNLDFSKSDQLRDCYSSFHYFTGELEIILDRIEEDLQGASASTQKLND